MKKIKGCLNETCTKKKIKYKTEETFCPYCGGELAYVCKKCVLKEIEENAKSNICVVCQDKKDDLTDKIKDSGKKAGKTLLRLVPFLFIWYKKNNNK